MAVAPETCKAPTSICGPPSGWRQACARIDYADLEKKETAA